MRKYESLPESGENTASADPTSLRHQQDEGVEFLGSLSEVSSITECGDGRMLPLRGS